MDSSNIEIISDCFIKPKFLPEEAKKPIYLSPWDLIMISVNYGQNGLLFSLPENQDFSITTFLENLKNSLSATLTYFHPLTTRLTTVKQENPSSFTIILTHENSPGARFIHATVNLTVADILTPTHVPLIVQSFFDHQKAINYDGHELSLLSVKVTQLIDGIFIGCSINHLVADGTSFWHFFSFWSEMFRSKMNISRLPIVDRGFSEGSDPIVTLPYTGLKHRPNRPFLRERIFHFSSHSLSKLKAKVNFECNTTKISTLQSISALVWRCVTRAWRLSPDQETSCVTSVNNRSRISPPIPETYFGNMIQPIKITTTVGELLDCGVGWAALRLHEAVIGHGDKQIKEMDSFLKKSCVLNTTVRFDGNRVQIGNSPRFDMYGTEFGLGKPLAVLSGYGNKFDGKVSVYPGRDGGGSMDLEVCLLPENMAVFESDEEFMSVVNDGFMNKCNSSKMKFIKSMY